MLLYEDITKRPTFKIDENIKTALQLHFDKVRIQLIKSTLGHIVMKIISPAVSSGIRRSCGEG